MSLPCFHHMTSASPPLIWSSKKRKWRSLGLTMVFPAFPSCPRFYSGCTTAQSKICHSPSFASKASRVCKIGCYRIVTFLCWSSRKSAFYCRKIQTTSRTKMGYSRTSVFCGRGTFYLPSRDFRKLPCCGFRRVQKRWCLNQGRSHLQGPHRDTWICGRLVAITLCRMKGKSHTKRFHSAGSEAEAESSTRRPKHSRQCSAWWWLSPL